MTHVLNFQGCLWLLKALCDIMKFRYIKESPYYMKSDETLYINPDDFPNDLASYLDNDFMDLLETKILDKW